MKGRTDELLLEGKLIQQRLSRLTQNQKTSLKVPHAFSKLKFQGKTKDALCLLSENNSGVVLHRDELVPSHDHDSWTVLEVLKCKIL